jgi:two-component system chemotaxis sensor kinase CheA
MSPTSAEQKEKIRRLFAAESATRLDGLAMRLLELERVGQDAELVEEIFREAHTLKGSASIVGFPNVTKVAHAIEDLLEELRSGRRQATPDLVDAVLSAVDGLRSMIPRIMEGNDCGPEAADLVRSILATQLGADPEAQVAGTGPDAVIDAPDPEIDAPDPEMGAAEPEAGADAPDGPLGETAPREAADQAEAASAEAASGDGSGAGGEHGDGDSLGEGPDLQPGEAIIFKRGPGGLVAWSGPEDAPDDAAPADSDVTPEPGESTPAAESAPEPSVPEPVEDSERKDRRSGRRDRRRSDSGSWDETVRVPVDRLDRFVRQIGETAAAHLRLSRALVERFGSAAADLEEVHTLARSVNELQESAMQARMVPVETITGQLHRAVRDLARKLGKRVRWEEDGTDTELDRNVLEQLSGPLMHLVRNAVDHGLEDPADRQAAGKSPIGRVWLRAAQLGSDVVVTVADDGRGVNVDRVRAVARAQGKDALIDDDSAALEAIFGSGISTAEQVSDVSGRGVGLDVVRANVEAIRGRVEVRSTPGRGTEFRIVVPITLAVMRCLLVETAGSIYALPMHSIELVRHASPAEASRSDGRTVLWIKDEPVPLADLGALLGGAPYPDRSGPAVIINSLFGRYAFRVDRLVAQRDLVIKGLGRLIPRLGLVAGASVEPDGSVLLVLDAAGMIEQATSDRDTAVVPTVSAPAAPPPAAVLVVDDSLAVRELERSILERAGYEVRTAADGVEALALLAERPADLVVSDIEMPRMDGFTLTGAIRAEPAIRNVAVLLLTSRSSEDDRRRGLAAGADGYMVKSAFEEQTLLDAVERLLGGRIGPWPAGAGRARLAR